MCKGKDSMGRACGLEGAWDGLCYFHDKVKVGLLTEFYEQHKTNGEYIMVPIKSTPRPGVAG
jgi:hypothetical protein